MHTSNAVMELKKSSFIIATLADHALRPSVRHKPAQFSSHGSRKLLETSINDRLGFTRANDRSQPHQRTVGSLSRKCIPQQVQLDQVFVCEISIALLKPVQDDLFLLSPLNDGTIGPERLHRRR